MFWGIQDYFAGDGGGHYHEFMHDIHFELTSKSKKVLTSQWNELTSRGERVITFSFFFSSCVCVCVCWGGGGGTAIYKCLKTNIPPTPPSANVFT